MIFVFLIVFPLVFSVIFSFLDLIYFKIYQLSGYHLASYIKSVTKFRFSFGKKTPLKFTKRVKRLFFFDFFTKFAVFFLVFWFFDNFLAVFLTFIFALFFSPFFVIFSFLLALPVEELIKRKYIFRAKRKLKKSKCKVVAITGSYGKTSTKEFLAQFLSCKFSVCSSPKSYNTL